MKLLKTVLWALASGAVVYATGVVAGGLSAWQGESERSRLLFDDNLSTLWVSQLSWNGTLQAWRAQFRVDSIDANVGGYQVVRMPTRLRFLAADPDVRTVVGREVGWPLPVVDGHFILSGSGKRYDWAIPFNVGGPVFFPLRPRIAGILIWSIILSALGHLCSRVWQKLRGSRCRKKGLCAKCGYVLDNQMIRCPECGTAPQ